MSLEDLQSFNQHDHSPQLLINFHPSNQLSMQNLLFQPVSLSLPLNGAPIADHHYMQHCFQNHSLLLVEIISVIDLSQSINKQQNTTQTESKIFVDEVEVQEKNNEKINNKISNRRLVKFLMSDGLRFIVGIEYRPLPFAELLLQCQYLLQKKCRKNNEINRPDIVLGRAILYNRPECIDGVLLLQEANIRLLSHTVGTLSNDRGSNLQHFPSAIVPIILPSQKSNGNISFLETMHVQHDRSYFGTSSQCNLNNPSLNDTNFPSPTKNGNIPFYDATDFDDLVDEIQFSPSPKSTEFSLTQNHRPHNYAPYSQTPHVSIANTTLNQLKASSQCISCPGNRESNSDDMEASIEVSNQQLKQISVFYGMCCDDGIKLGPITSSSSKRLEELMPWTTDGYIDSCPSAMAQALWNFRNVPLPSDEAWVMKVVSSKHQRIFHLLVRVRESESHTFKECQMEYDLPDTSVNFRHQSTAPGGHEIPDILVLSTECFNRMYRESTGLFLCNLFDKHIIRVSSSIIGADISPNFTIKAEGCHTKTISLDGEIISWSPTVYEWPDVPKSNMTS